MTNPESVPYLPVTVHQRPEDSRTNIGFQTFSSANFSTVWGVDHFSAAGVLSTSDERAALSNSIDRVLATASGFQETAISDCVRLLAVSLPRNRPIMNRVLDTVPPLQAGCDMTVLAPVASAQEAEAIPAFLDSLVQQNLPPENWNALLFLNMADREPGVSPVPDNSERHIEDFKRAHPELQIHVIKVHYSEVQPIGAIRHDAACAALVRHVARFPRGPADHLLVMADADQSKAGPRWLETFHRLSMRDPNSSAFQGHYLWDRYTLGNDPGILGFTICDFAIRSFFQARFPEEGAAGGGGPNLAVRASKFALCGY
ncbi:MAG: hypothetical protein J0M12_10545, partial [Deltaproteobacteria bacterium]|nr:hypothetical protein [Deltaproteobacteria bacterium]